MSGPFDDLIPGKAPGSIAPRKGMIFTPPPDSVGAQQKTVDLGKSRTEADIAAQTAPYRIQQAKNEAQKSAIDLKNAQDAAAGSYGDPTLTGAARLASVPPDKRGMVELLVNNKLPGLSTFALSKPQIQAYLSTAQAVDPTFDPSLMGVRYQAMRDFSGAGKASQAVGAVNRLAANLQTLKGISDRMGGPNLGFAPLNKLVAGTEQEFEPTLKASYDSLLPEIANQFDLIMKSNKGSPTVSGIDEAMQGLGRARSQAEREAAFTQVAKAIHGAIEPLKDEWDSAYGGTKAPPMWISKGASDFFGSVDPEHADDYGGKDWRGLPGLKGDGSQPTPFGGLPPPGGGAPPGSPPPNQPPSVGPKSPPGGLGGRPDYSTMVGGPSQNLATGSTRAVFDPIAASTLSTFIRKGAPYQTAADYATSHGLPAPDPKQYQDAVAFAQSHNGATNVEAVRDMPTTLGERLAASPAAAAVVGGTAGATAGLSDVLGRTLIPGFAGNRAALAATNPTADVLGNVGGGLASAFGGPTLLGRIAPSIADAASAFSEAHPALAPALGDMAYGGLYGANESPDNPLQGGLTGAITAGGAGLGVRKALGGLSGILSPSAGPFQLLYDAGGYPTLGQKLSATGGITGKIVNTGEQALQSFPGLGMMVAGARQAPRDAGQIGAFNNSLKELAPFGNIPTALPAGMGPGTDAHAFTSGQFDKAYDTARSGMQFAPDAQYLADAQNLAAKVNNGVLSPDQASQVQNVVNNAVVGRLKAQGGTLNGDAFKAASSDLNRAIQTWGKNPGTAPMADALSDYTTIFDNAARRNSDPAAVNLLDSADRGYAQLVRIQRASELGGAAKDAGTFTPVNYAQAVKQMGGGVRSSAYNQGLALGQDYANALLPLRDTLPTSGTSERLLTGQALAGLGGAEIGAGGFLAAHPGSVAPFAAYVPGVRDVVNRAIAPNAQRLSLLPPDVTAALDAASAKIDNLALPISQAVVPGALAYRLSQ